MKTYIYTLSDPDTNEVRYVGKSVNPEIRVRRHISEAKNTKYKNHRINWLKSLSNKGLKPIINIIDETEGNWEWLECYWISQFKSWGFNLVNGTDGGENPPSWKGRTHSNEHKEKLRQIMLSEKNPAKKMTNNWKEKISLSHKRNCYTPVKASLANMKKIKQYSLVGEYIKTWQSVTEAAKFCNLKSISGILEVCNNKRLKSGGFRWSYEDKELINYVSKRDKKPIQQQNINGKIIKTWSSISEASKKLKIDCSSISKACKGKVKSAGGYKWCLI